MSNDNGIAIAIGVVLVGAAAYVFLKKQQPVDPLGNLINAAPGLISGAGAIAGSALDTGSSLIKKAGNTASSLINTAGDVGLNLVKVGSGYTLAKAGFNEIKSWF